ncbi:hypothetical protein Q8F57_009035 [Paraburkholderia terrae]|uniref:hypothetical protein n=1 Tax=Paraburkholderia terrae TaxID=311230 RepID=UPI00296A9A56|nr:hypothetical protein [Paraburkholderia terrae]
MPNIVSKCAMHRFNKEMKLNGKSSAYLSFLTTSKKCGEKNRESLLNERRFGEFGRLNAVANKC